jgi:hypothetical protein
LQLGCCISDAFSIFTCFHCSCLHKKTLPLYPVVMKCFQIMNFQ